MKKNLILIFAVLAFGLAACGQLAEEATPSAVPTSSPQPTAIVTAAVTPAASATVTPAVISTPEPAPTAPWDQSSYEVWKGRGQQARPWWQNSELGLMQ